MSHLIGSMYPGHSEKPSLVGMLRSLHPARWTGCLDWSFVISSGKTSAFSFFTQNQMVAGPSLLANLVPFLHGGTYRQTNARCLPSRETVSRGQTALGGHDIWLSFGREKSWYLPSDASGWIMVIKVDSSWWFTFSKRTLIRKGLLVGGIVE